VSLALRIFGALAMSADKGAVRDPQRLAVLEQPHIVASDDANERTGSWRSSTAAACPPGIVGSDDARRERRT